MENRTTHSISKNTYLVLIIIIHVFIILIVAGKKQEYHIDEIYSYIISNSYDADRISNADWMWGSWISGSDFNDFISVQESERFSYKTVYFNTSTDCHPPLFYWLLHTVCSFFPNQFSKWFGIGINIICFIITEVFLYLVSREVISSKVWRFFPVIVYGMSPFAIETCTFIRMYMLLTMFAMIFIYAHMLLFQKGFSWKRFFIIWLTIYLGSLTQYYFLIMCFWGVLIYALILLRKKEIKQMLIYGIGASISVGLMLITFPYAIIQATGSSTNNVGNEVARNLLNFKLWIKMSISLSKQLMASVTYYRPLSVIIALFLLISVVGKMILFLHQKKRNFNERTIWIAMLSILTILAITFIGGEFVYLRYIYFIIPIIYVVVISMFENMGNNLGKFKTSIAVFGIGLLSVSMLLGTIENRSPYLFFDSANENKVLLKYQKYPLIVLMEDIETCIPTGILTKLAGFDTIYMDTKEHIETNKIISDSLINDGKCIIFVPTDTYWINGYDPDKLLNNMADTSNCVYEKVTNGFLGEFYYCSQISGTP